MEHGDEATILKREESGWSLETRLQRNQSHHDCLGLLLLAPYSTEPIRTKQETVNNIQSLQLCTF